MHTLAVCLTRAHMHTGIFADIHKDTHKQKYTGVHQLNKALLILSSYTQEHYFVLFRHKKIECGERGA